MTERTKEYLVSEVRNFLASLPEKGSVGPLTARVIYLGDLPGGSLIEIHDPTLGRRVFHVSVTQRRGR